MFSNKDHPKTLNDSEIMKPTWNKLINELKDKHKNEIILGAIESSNMDMFKKSGISPSVSGFPTILYFHPNNITRHEVYKGDRSYEHLKKWILDKKNKGKGRSNKSLVILTNYNANNAEKKNVMNMGMGKKKGFEFSQYGGGTRRRRMGAIRKFRSRRKMSMRKNTRRRYRR